RVHQDEGVSRLPPRAEVRILQAGDQRAGMPAQLAPPQLLEGPDADRGVSAREERDDQAVPGEDLLAGDEVDQIVGPGPGFGAGIPGERGKVGIAGPGPEGGGVAEGLEAFLLATRPPALKEGGEEI